MARLTRTQKYAGLRENLANDKEASIETKELSSYQNKLSNLTGERYPSQNSYQQNYQQRPIESDPRYTWTEFDETPINELVDQFKNQGTNSIANNSVFNSIQEMPRTQTIPNDYDIAKLEEEDYIDDLVDSIRIDTSSPYDRSPQRPAYQQSQPQYQQPVNNYNYQQPQYQQPQQPVYQQPVYQQPQQPVYQQPQPQQPQYQQPQYQQPAYQQPQYQHPQQSVYQQPAETVKENLSDIEAFADFGNKKTKVEETYKEPERVETLVEQPRPVEPVEIEQPKVSEPVQIKADIPVNPDQSRTTFDMADRIQDMFDTTDYVEETPVSFEKTEEVDRLEPDHSNDTARSYVSETIKEVSDYNKQNGEQTIGQLTNHMVNEIRHHEDNYEPKQEYKQPVAAKPETEEDYSNTVSMEISKIIDEVSEVEKQDTEKRMQQAVQEKPAVEEHPVLAQKLEETIEENVVEIKNLNELEAEEATLTRDTVSNTIPFVVTNDDDEDLDEDEEGSNTILNIILIVLIIILVIVLGLIVFYILKTKGII